MNHVEQSTSNFTLSAVDDALRHAIYSAAWGITRSKASVSTRKATWEALESATAESTWDATRDACREFTAAL